MNDPSSSSGLRTEDRVDDLATGKQTEVAGGMETEGRADLRDAMLHRASTALHPQAIAIDSRRLSSSLSTVEEERTRIRLRFNFSFKKAGETDCPIPIRRWKEEINGQ